MGIKKNPFGVGYSGGGKIEEIRTCQCCQIEFIWTGTKDIYSQIPICSHCRKHSLHSPQQKLDALSEHQQRLVEAVQQARKMARKLKRENEELEQEVQSRRWQTAAALESRNRYQGMLEELEAIHYVKDGHCACKKRSCDVLRIIKKHSESYYY